MKKSLQEIWDELNEQGYGSDKGSVHSYLPLYEQILAPYRDTALNVLEIGVFKGDSLRLWESYFSNANVHGIDCSETPINGMADLRPMIASGKHNIHILDATNESEIERVFGETKWDLVLDDSSHLIEHQLQTINIFKKRITENGLIILEDIQDMDNTYQQFYQGEDHVMIQYDRRHIKDRYDDVVIIIKNK